jgi:transposase/phosphoglycolate phosphatase-like HAD superfamily hydrolase
MIPAELHNDILRLHHVERWPPNTIARQLRIHHSTVMRVLIRAGLQVAVRSNRPSKVDPYVGLIEQTLERWPTLSAARLFAMARERGYTGGESQLRARVALLRPRPKAEAYLRLRTLRGEQGQVDWAHCGHITIGRAKRPLMAFVMVLSYSRAVWLRFFVDARMASFLAGHQSAFEAFGGRVPKVLLYDNLKSAVLERHHDAIRFNPTLLAFAQHYRFEPRPVAVARGNQKGRVERAIRYIRGAFLAGRTYTDLDDLNAQAAHWCFNEARQRRCTEDLSRSVDEVFAEEQPHLLEMPADHFDRHERVSVSIGKTPYARFDLNDYSVPHNHVCRKLELIATTDRVRILNQGAVIADHPRSYDRDTQIEDRSHIQALIDYKRASHKHATSHALIQAIPAVGELLNAAAARGYNLGSIVAALDRLRQQYGLADLKLAIEQALTRDVPHPHAVRQVLEQLRIERKLPPATPVTLPQHVNERDVIIAPHALGPYDKL